MNWPTTSWSWPWARRLAGPAARRPAGIWHPGPSPGRSPAARRYAQCGPVPGWWWACLGCLTGAPRPYSIWRPESGVSPARTSTWCIRGRHRWLRSGPAQRPASPRCWPRRVSVTTGVSRSAGWISVNWRAHPGRCCPMILRCWCRRTARRQSLAAPRWPGRPAGRQSPSRASCTRSIRTSRSWGIWPRQALNAGMAGTLAVFEAGYAADRIREWEKPWEALLSSGCRPRRRRAAGSLSSYQARTASGEGPG